MSIASQNTLIPRSVLFGNPEKTSPQISPDGKRMAYLAPVNGVLNVWVGTVGQDDYQPVTRDTDRGVRLYIWAADNRHILYIQDSGGDENWHLYASNLETGDTRDLTPFENIQVQILARNKHFPNALLIAINKENPQVHDAYHLDLTSGELTLVARNSGPLPGRTLRRITERAHRLLQQQSRLVYSRSHQSVTRGCSYIVSPGWRTSATRSAAVARPADLPG